MNCQEKENNKKRNLDGKGRKIYFKFKQKDG